ncbi:hypothetical protein HJ590_12890 [Naumannella sp. ID2617S]|uniref:Sigma-70 family RNA polymerase sigma factor n=1 Tax=Enemella dayhoffiae TaxID=2016507 RepID=A0A255H122_9ACTN|nr:hypothetical protein [Enemella dayhoffiae]NNG20443.1 hypothetical protein [Naumannella sp. ID2617S]OYO21369.1 hypothetical protein CGZ93_10515 [Enemella dayhoffiae]
MISSSARVGELAAEWDYLLPRSDAVVQGWAERHSALTACRDLGSVLSAIAADPDPVLGALLSEDVAGCPVAARVVMQTMLPKMMAFARGDRYADTDDYLAHLWFVIRRYPLARRPHRIAANLALDTLKSVRAEWRHAPVPMPESELERVMRAPEPVDPITARQLLRAARRLGLIDTDTHALLTSVYAEGASGEVVAERHQLRPGTVRQRCHRAVRRLAAHAQELVDAA